MQGWGLVAHHQQGGCSMRSLRHSADACCLCCLGVMHECDASLPMHDFEVCSACGRLSTSRPGKLVLPHWALPGRMNRSASALSAAARGCQTPEEKLLTVITHLVTGARTGTGPDALSCACATQAPSLQAEQHDPGALVYMSLFPLTLSL